VGSDVVQKSPRARIDGSVFATERADDPLNRSLSTGFGLMGARLERKDRSRAGLFLVLLVHELLAWLPRRRQSGARIVTSLDRQLGLMEDYKNEGNQDVIGAQRRLDRLVSLRFHRQVAKC